MILVYNLVIFWLTTTDADNPPCHGFQRIHTWSITVELVEDSIAAIHHFYIFSKWYTFRHTKFYLIGIFLSNGLCSLEHDVCAFIFASAFADTDEQFYLFRDVIRNVGILWISMDRKGDKCSFLWKTWLITCPVFIESSYDSITIFRYHIVETFLFRSKPVFSFFQCISIGP